MRVHELHEWDVTPAEARAIQARLRERVSLVDALRPEDVRVVAGADNGYRGRGREATAWAAVVVLAFPELTVLEQRVASLPARFPYVPGLLSFREAPALLAAFRLVEHEPDVVLFDGQGIAHPRRLGLAAHLGLWLERPAIGCAKSRLTGSYQEPADERGARSPLLLDGDDTPVGDALRTKPGHAPLFVSPGHRVSVATATAIALACTRPGQFMPEPTRLADRLVREAKVSERVSE